MCLILSVLSLFKTTPTPQTLRPIPEDAFEHMQKHNPCNRSQVRGLRRQKVKVSSFLDMPLPAWAAERIVQSSREVFCEVSFMRPT